MAKREIAIIIDLILIEKFSYCFPKVQSLSNKLLLISKKDMIINDVQMENGI